MCTGRIRYELVLKECPWVNAALVEPSSTIRGSCSVLEHAVEMYCCSFIPKLIVRIHDNLIAEVHVNCRRTNKVLAGTCRSSTHLRPLTIDTDDWPDEAIWSSLGVVRVDGCERQIQNPLISTLGAIQT